MIQSFGVLTTLLAWRGVVLDTGTAGAVTYPQAATSFPIGITKDTVLETTGSIEVAGHGEIAKLYMNETMGTGLRVALDSSGRGVPHVDTTAGSYVLGILVGPAVALTGTIADVYIMPHFKSIP